jgi:hypothetical protein
MSEINEHYHIWVFNLLFNVYPFCVQVVILTSHYFKIISTYLQKVLRKKMICRHRVLFSWMLNTILKKEKNFQQVEVLPLRFCMRYSNCSCKISDLFFPFLKNVLRLKRFTGLISYVLLDLNNIIPENMV